MALHVLKLRFLIQKNTINVIFVKDKDFYGLFREILWNFLENLQNVGRGSMLILSFFYFKLLIIRHEMF